MASSLTVITGIGSALSSRSFAAPVQDETTGQPADLFAALLGQSAEAPSQSEADPQAAVAIATNVAAAVTTTPSTATPSTTVKASASIDLSTFGSDEPATEDPESDTADTTETADPVAAAIDVIAPIQPTETAPTALIDLVNGLADIKAKLDVGQPLDRKTLQRLDSTLSELANALNIGLDTIPTPDQLQALVDALPADDTSLDAQLVRALAPVASDLQTTQADTRSAATLNSIGEKLAALLQGIESEDVDVDLLNKLGLQADATAEVQTNDLYARLEKAVSRITPPAVSITATIDTVELAKPELTLDGGSLTGKTETTADASKTTTVAPADPSSESQDGKSGEHKSSEPKASEAKPTEQKSAERAPAQPVAAAVDKRDDPRVDTVASSQPTQSARVDAIAPRTVQVGYQTSQQQLNLPQLAFEIARQAGDGNTRFQIRLDPAELGRIDVKLDIDSSGNVNARLTVEKPETLDLMQRDQRGLEKALQQAGLDGTKTNLEFSLKDNAFSGGRQSQYQQQQSSSFGMSGEDEASDSLPTVNLYRGALSASGVNIIA